MGFALVKIDFNKMYKRYSRRAFAAVRYAAGSTRKYIRNSIKYRKRRVPSPPGRPPFTHTGLLRRSIVYNLERLKPRATVGPSPAIIGPIGALHERGGTRFRRKYPARPFVKPAVQWARGRLMHYWRTANVTYTD